MKANNTFSHWSLIMLLAVLSSCSTYKSGYITTIPHNEDNDSTNQVTISQLKTKKQALNRRSKEIMKSIEEQQKAPKAIHAHEINSLFENLQNHYKIDSVLHHIYLHSTNKALSHKAKQMILESAVSYNMLFQHNKHIRRIINRGNSTYSFPPRMLAKSQNYLWKIARKDDTREQIISLQGNYRKEKTIDNIFLAWYALSGTTSKLVSSLISMSHLEPKPEKYLSRLLPVLETGDIICQKSRGRLSDKFIPGYFGHAAIYLGDSCFAEAILNGAVTSNPYKFAEGDSYLIIRHKNLTSEKKKQIINSALAQQGKKYDFQYDTESPNKLTCAEMIYLTYDFTDWETGHTAGRYLITPDNIVSTALKEPDFEFISYFDNEVTLDRPKKSYIKNLLND
ncbi:MAG TPA: YiiX/YebB-like N1pC/P60 family cysteine hydrolase [Prolixibacteraceae bacterium]|nr:YiiX/YebB-like N1pC/P60 family cysteine hydrolase [Prolixibacteraceae bacterium]